MASKREVGDRKGAPDEIRVDAYTLALLKSPHGCFLYVKQQARRFLASADYIVGKLPVLTTGDYIDSKHAIIIKRLILILIDYII